MKVEGAASRLILEPAGEGGGVEEDARVRVVSLESAGTILQVKVIARVHPPSSTSHFPGVCRHYSAGKR